MLQTFRKFRFLTLILFVLLWVYLSLLNRKNLKSRRDTNTAESSVSVEQSNADISLTYRPYDSAVNLINFKKFALEHNCPIDGPFYARIFDDLNPFVNAHRECVAEKKCDPHKSRPITRQMIERASNLDATIRIEIKSGVVKSDLWSDQAKYIEPFAHLLPDMVIVQNQFDQPRILAQFVNKSSNIASIFYDANTGLFKRPKCTSIIDLMKLGCSEYSKRLELHPMFTSPAAFSATDELLPVFSTSTYSGCFRDIIWPYPHMFFEHLSNEMRSANLTEWNDRYDRVFWRGSTTGSCYPSKTNFVDGHLRFKLVEKSLRKGGAFATDAKFTFYTNCDNETCQNMEKQFGPVEKKSTLLDHTKYKYLADVDGNSYSMRFIDFLRYTKSLVFKIHLIEDYVTRLVEPYEHFMPVNLNLSDYEEKVEWAIRNDRNARYIAENGHRFARDYLNFNMTYCYYFRLLVEYAALVEM